MSAALQITVAAPRPGSAALLARAAQADSRGAERLSAAIDDFLLPDDGRLDEVTRAGVEHALAGAVMAMTRDVVTRARRILDGSRVSLRVPNSVLPQLLRAGALRDPELMGELIARVRLETLAGGLATIGVARSNLAARLGECANAEVASAADALLHAERCRRKPDDDGQAGGLPAELHTRLLWWVTAALRAHQPDDAPAAVDAALVEAARDTLAAFDEEYRLEVAAMRLVRAIDARAEELPELLTEALSDHRPAVFVAALAHAAALSDSEVRGIVVAPGGARLWVLLRLLDLDALTIMKIWRALVAADPQRDMAQLDDALGDVAAIAPDEAAATLAPLNLPRDYREALRAIARAR